MLTAGHEPYCRRTKIMTENYLDFDAILLDFIAARVPQR